MPTERLSKVLSQHGVASRRECDVIIASGKVKVNGLVQNKPYFPVDFTTDRILVNNIELAHRPSFIYVALYKPIGFISDLSDPCGRKIARGLISIKERLFPVGRLDFNSEGLIIFTNDGCLADKIMHPRNMIEKEYYVKISGHLDSDGIALLNRGIIISGQLLKTSSIKELKRNHTNGWYSIIIREGKNRMIRKMLDGIHHNTIRLKRIRIANIRLGNLQPGDFRLIGKEEIMTLMKTNSI
jgi:23S rRNA pseudouridine2605 synthase